MGDKAQKQADDYNKDISTVLTSLYNQSKKAFDTEYIEAERYEQHYMDEWDLMFEKKVSEYTRDGSVAGRIIERPRTNQPMGYDEVGEGNATEYYGEKHNYVFYPCDWRYNDMLYKKGFYDENGKHYDRVVFEKKGVYQKIDCKCDYCGTSVRLNWDTGETLQCRNCGGSITVETPIDVYTQDPDYTEFMKSHKKELIDEENPRYNGTVSSDKEFKKETIQAVALFAGFIAAFILILSFITGQH